MHRCTPCLGPSVERPHSPAARLLLAFSFTVGAAFAGLLASLPTPAQAQMQPSVGAARNFPEAALRGTLVVTGQNMAEVNGKAIRMAPGMRLLNPENALLMLHTVIGQKLTVNYLIEPSTGMLWTAWVLSPAETAQQRKGSGVQRNYLFESESSSAR
jgi:hypothetical protein